MLTVLLQVAAALVGAVLLWVFWLHYKCTMAPVPGGRRIPGPPQTPLFGHVLPLLKRAEFHYEYVHQLVLKYGPICRLQLFQFGMTWVLVSDPKLIKELIGPLVLNGSVGKSDVYREQFKELFGNGIFGTNPPDSFEHRELAKGLLQPEALQRSLPIFIRHARALITHLDTNGLHKNIDVQEFFLRYTLSAFGEAGFGVELHAIQQDENLFGNAFDYIQAKCFERLNLGPMWKFFPTDKRFVSAVSYINQFCADVVKERRKESAEALALREDLLSRILVAKHEDGSPYTDVEIVDFVRNFLVAGRDTTASLLTFVVYELSRHPEIEARVVAEIAEEIGAEEPSMANVSRLRYLKAVLQETLRMYPPVPGEGYGVLLDEGITFAGYHIPKNGMLAYNAYTLHRLPELWPEPEVWNPARFVDASPKPYTFLPFHGGPRQCLGMDMAYLEARVALVILLRQYKFVLLEGFTPKLRSTIILTVATPAGMRMHLQPRA